MPIKKKDKNQYYTVGANLRGRPPGWLLVNYDSLQKDWRGISQAIPWPDGYLQLPRGPWRIPDFIERPRFLIARKYGKPPSDLECIDGFWIISMAMKKVLEAIDPLACEFRECETVLTSNETGPDRWLCSITRAFVGAVEIESSDKLFVRSNPNGTVSFGRTLGTVIKFKPEVIGASHLFHVAEMASAIFCDQSMKDACKVAGIKGISFQCVS